MNIINNTIQLKREINSQIDKTSNKELIISKTLNSVVFLKNNILYCYNNFCYETLNVSSIIKEIYFNDKFYIMIHNNNLIVLIDETFKKKNIFVPFECKEVYIKQNYILIKNLKMYLLINTLGTVYLKNYELYELCDKLLLNHEKNNNYLIENGFIEQVKFSDNLKKLIKLLKYTNGLNNLLDLFDIN